MKENPTYYAIIPANVRYADLKPNAKLLYGEISALSNKCGFCFASNKYFAELYKVNKNTISSWLSDLKNYGFITVKIERDANKQIIKRCIGITKIMDNPIHEKMKGNTTSINTTSNNIYIKEKFISQVMYFDYPKEMKLRLERWSKNSLKWDSPKNKTTSKLDSQISEWQKAKELL